MNKRELEHVALLLLATIIWGSAFVAQSVGAEYVGALTFLTLRSFLACLVLFPVILIKKKKIDKTAVKAGINVGVWLFAASYLQQLGIASTTTAKAGFITTLYIIFVPVLSFFLSGKKIEKKIIFCIFLSTCGLFLLNKMTFVFEFSDLLLIGCALLFSGQIMAIDRYSSIDSVVLSAFQFLSVGMIAGIGTLLFEEVSCTAILSASSSILYAGVMSSGIAYTLQIIGQRDVPVAVASLAMSMESAFAALFGFLILKQTLATGELIGCLLMFSSIILSQIPFDLFHKHKEVKNEH